MITTPDLIESLTERLTPVHRLRPVRNACCWILLAVAVLGLVAMGQGLRPDLSQRLGEASYLSEISASLLTGICAAIAASMLSLPDRSRLWFLLPIPALAAWLSTIGYQCLYAWVSLGPGGISLGESARCFATLVFSGLPLSFAMLVMLRHAAVLRSAATTFAASLAVAALTASALSLLHDIDATMMILLWNLGTTALIVGLSGLFRRRMFGWVLPHSAVP